MKNFLMMLGMLMACTVTVQAEEAMAVPSAAQAIVEQDASEPIEEPKPMENVPIALVAPSGSAIPVERYEKGVAVLEDRGFKVTSYYNPELHYERFAAADAVRLRQMEQAVRRSAVACYAAEGSYPPDLDHLREHYGLQVNEKRYLVDYTVFAENLMPEITVLRNGG